MPTIVMVSWASLLFIANRFLDMFKSLQEACPEYKRMITPVIGCLAHILARSQATASLIAGGEMIIYPEYNVDQILSDLPMCNFFVATPYVYSDILEHDTLHEYIGKLRGRKMIYLVSGDKCPLELCERFMKAFKQPLLQAYVLTEGTMAFMSLYNKWREGSLGFVTPTVDILLRDPNTGELRETGEGELLVSAPFMSYVSLGIYKDLDKTKETYLEIDGKIFCRTGDLVRVEVINREKWGYFLGRTEEVIKFKGMQIAACEIEDVISSFPGVDLVAVIGVPRGEAEEVPVAYVKLKGEARGVTEDAIIRWCMEKLAPYKVPRRVIFVTHMPTGRVGKLLKRKLIELAAEMR
jgi:acyl-CoA synthetase (AMP-forming)/AMP-acid ligase II